MCIDINIYTHTYIEYIYMLSFKIYTLPQWIIDKACMVYLK